MFNNTNNSVYFSIFYRSISHIDVCVCSRVLAGLITSALVSLLFNAFKVATIPSATR